MTIIHSIYLKTNVFSQNISVIFRKIYKVKILVYIENNYFKGHKSEVVNLKDENDKCEVAHVQAVSDLL